MDYLSKLANCFGIMLNSQLRLIGISIISFITDTHHSSDGPLETMAEREDAVFACIDYNLERKMITKMARRLGLEHASYSAYKQHLGDKPPSPRSKVFLDVMAPNRKRR